MVASSTCVETCVGWPNGLGSFLICTRKSQKKKKKNISGQTYPVFHWLILLLMDVTQLALTWFGWPNGEKLASTFVEIVRKSTQVHASPGQTGPQVDPSFQLASTCYSVWPGLQS